MGRLSRHYPPKKENPYPKTLMLPPKAPSPFLERNKVPENPEETREKNVETPDPPRSPKPYNGRPGYRGSTPEEFKDATDNADPNDGRNDDTDARSPPGPYDQLPCQPHQPPRPSA